MMRQLSGTERAGKRKRNTGAGGQDLQDGGGSQVEKEFISQPEPQIPLEIIVKRQARQAKLWAESAERLRNGTRRRRLKGWAGLPPDVGLPPRFPSELTLEESRGVLGLDKKTYFALKDVFQEICKTHNVVRKTTSGPEKWSVVKEEFINRSPQLLAIFRGPGAGQFDPNREPMALDLICMDVTKRMRTAGKYLSLLEAKNILNLTPDETREVRGVFDSVLKADFFTGKLDVTKEHWEGLKEKWIQQAPRLQRELVGIENDELWQRKYRALETVARDVQKRNRDSQTKKDPTFNNGQKATTPKKPKAAKPPKPTPTRAAQLTPALASTNNDGRLPCMPSEAAPISSAQDTSGIEALASQALSSTPLFTSDYQIDPSLLEVAAQIPSPNPQTSPPPTHGISIYIRPSPLTAVKYPSLSKVWAEMLPEPYTIANLKRVIARKVGVAGKVGKVEGLADARTVETGGGSKWAVEEDDELEAYLGYVGQAGKKTFVVEVD